MEYSRFTRPKYKAFEVKIDSQATVLTLKTMISGIYGLIRPFQRL